MAFEGIRSYFDKFTILRPPQSFVRSIFIDACYAVCGITLKPHEVNVRDTVVYVTTNPIIKSELLEKRQEILSRVCDRARARVISEIR